MLPERNTFFRDKYGGLRVGRIAAIGALTVAATVGKGCGSCNNSDYGAGTRVGVINKISKKGYIWKTYEGQMALEGIVSNGQNVGANVWEFSVDQEHQHGENVKELTYKLNQALESGRKVQVKYIEAGCPWPTRGSTSYYIQSVEVIPQ